VPTRPRDRILNAATRLFYRKGIPVVGVNHVAVEADVALMTLYRHFGNKDKLVAEALEQWSAEWLHSLNDKIDRCGDDPDRRVAGLWDALEDWLATEGFCGSFVDNAATELRGKHDHPAMKVITEHRMALHQLLEGLAKVACVRDPAGWAEQVQILIDGVVSVAVVDGRLDVAPGIRALAKAMPASGSA
jgi:AcrR family transcriptional regulator